MKGFLVYADKLTPEEQTALEKQLIPHCWEVFPDYIRHIFLIMVDDSKNPYNFDLPDNCSIRPYIPE